MAETGTTELARKLILLLNSELSDTENKGRRLAVSFSGGLDSTLLARVAMDHATISGIVVGTEDSTDIMNARRSADCIGIELKEIKINEEQVVEGTRRIIATTGLADPLTISFELPLFLVLRSMNEEMVMTGQGADELFGGYAKYKGLTEEDFARIRAEDVKKVLGPISRLEKKMADSEGKVLLRPFLSDKVVSYAMSLPIAAVRPIEERKAIIRKALIEFGLDGIAILEKKAAQYGSGISALLKKAAKREDMSVGEFMIHLRRRV